MEQITIIKPNGQTYQLQRSEPLTSIQKAEQVCELLGQDVVNVDFGSVAPIEMQLGMQINVFGKYYTLNVLPEVTKTSKWDFQYKCTFEGPQYLLMASQYFNADASGFYTGGDFSLTGDLEMFVNVLINNCNRTFGAGKWIKGEVQPTEVKTLTFSSVNCLAAIQTVICKGFEVEFDILQFSPDVKTIQFKKSGQVLSDVFQYGMGKGLYNLTRRSIKETTIVTRLYPFGSSENLNPGYRNLAGRLKIGEIGSDYIEDPAAIAAFGLIEAVKVFEDIKPGYEGSITETIPNNYYSFRDIFFPFDLLEKEGENHKYLIPGKTPKIHFNTGNLAGYEFELADGGYVNSTQVFTILPFSDERGLPFPNTTSPAFQFSHGDKFVILDIVMPEIYVTAAEGRLRTQAQLYLDANKSPLVQYSLTVDPAYLKAKTSGSSIPNFFGLGDYLRIKDTGMNIDKASRITRFTRNVLDPFVYSVEIADSYEIISVGRVVSDVKELKNIIELHDLRNPVTARQNWQSAREAFSKAFDPDGFLKESALKAETLETAMALIGTEGQQFQIINMVFMPNFEGQKNVVRYTAGQLVHLTIEVDNIRTWNIAAQTVSFTSDNTFKYIYAKCPRNDNNATILFSDSKLKTKEDPSYYHFLIGSLSSVDATTQTRQLSLSYGFTLISGRWITTGIIQSSDGSTFFNLDTGEIGGNITFRGTDGNNKPISQLETDLKALISDIAEQTDGRVESWFRDGVPTLLNEPAVFWTTAELKDAHLGDNYLDGITKKSYRFRYENGVYSWQEVSDDRITQALLLASQAKAAVDGKSTIFVSTPTTPYEEGDLWDTGSGIKKCLTTRLSGAFNPLDWDLASVYDNTVTAINGGMAVTGALYLANEDGTIKAFIRGGGANDNEILLALGASVENAEFAPMRARRSGILELRRRLELFNSSNQGVAGICGINSPSDGKITFWSGNSYGNRAISPWSVDMDGNMNAQKGQIGNIAISEGSLTNTVGSEFKGDAIIVLRDDANKIFAGFGTNVQPSSAGFKALARFENLEDDASPGHVKVALTVRAAGGTHPSAKNIALNVSEGLSLHNELLQNGSSTYEETISTSVSRLLDPSRYSFIAIYPTASGGVVGISFTTPSLPIKNGKTVRILNANDDYNNLFIYNLIRGNNSFQVNGGQLISMTYYNGYWYVGSTHDNNW